MVLLIQCFVASTWLMSTRCLHAASTPAAFLFLPKALCDIEVSIAFACPCRHPLHSFFIHLVFVSLDDFTAARGVEARRNLVWLSPGSGCHHCCGWNNDLRPLLLEDCVGSKSSDMCLCYDLTAGGDVSICS